MGRTSLLASKTVALRSCVLTHPYTDPVEGWAKGRAGFLFSLTVVLSPHLPQLVMLPFLYHSVWLDAWAAHIALALTYSLNLQQYADTVRVTIQGNFKTWPGSLWLYQGVLDHHTWCFCPGYLQRLTSKQGWRVLPISPLRTSCRYPPTSCSDLLSSLQTPTLFPDFLFTWHQCLPFSGQFWNILLCEWPASHV